MRLVDLDLIGHRWSQDFDRQVRTCFLQLPIAHVKGHNLVALSSHHSAGTRHRVMSTPTIPLPRMDLEYTLCALIKQKCACLLVLIAPEWNRVIVRLIDVNFKMNEILLINRPYTDTQKEKRYTY